MTIKWKQDPSGTLRGYLGQFSVVTICWAMTRDPAGPYSLSSALPSREKIYLRGDQEELKVKAEQLVGEWLDLAGLTVKP